MNGGFPPIKNKNIKKEIIKKNKKTKKDKKKVRFVSSKIENIQIKDILTITNKKKEKVKIIDEIKQINTVDSI